MTAHLMSKKIVHVVEVDEATVLKEWAERHQIILDENQAAFCPICGNVITEAQKRSSAIVARRQPFTASALMHAQCWCDEQEQEAKASVAPRVIDEEHLARIEDNYRLSAFLDDFRASYGSESNTACDSE